MKTQMMLGMIPLDGYEILLIAIALLFTAFWIWMLVDCAIRVSKDSKLVGWLIVIALLHVLGALLYFIFGRHLNVSKNAPVA